MDREKQIEEMYNSLAVAYGTANQYDSHLDERTVEDMAKHLYEAGYRKQSEGEWVEVENVFLYRYKCSLCENVMLGKMKNYCPNCGAKMKGDNK